MAIRETISRDPNFLKDRLKGMAARDKEFGKATKDYTDKDWDDAINAGQKYNENQRERVYNEAVGLGDTERIKPTDKDEYLFEDYFDYGAKKHIGDKYNDEFKESMRLQNTPYNKKKDYYDYGKAPDWLDRDLEEDQGKYDKKDDPESGSFFDKDYYEKRPWTKEAAIYNEDYAGDFEKGEKQRKRRIEELEGKKQKDQEEIDELEGADI